MAGRIQGVTVEIGGDTTKLQTALKGVMNLAAASGEDLATARNGMGLRL